MVSQIPIVYVIVVAWTMTWILERLMVCRGRRSDPFRH